MSGKYLLDTNVLIALFANEAGVREKLALAHEIYIPVIAVGELYYGAEKSQRALENRAQIDALVAESVILGCDMKTARVYGSLKSALRLKGRPIPENDLWIAAIAFEHELILATRDLHFRDIQGLTVEYW